MEHNVEITYYLSTVELSILMAGKGIRQLYMLQSEEVAIDNREVCLAMNHLYQNGIVDCTGEQFQIVASLNELLVGIHDATDALFLREGRNEENTICCFLGKDKMIAIQLSTIDNSTYKVFEMNEGILKKLIAKSMGRGEIYQPVLEEERMYEQIKQYKTSVPKELIRRFRNIAWIVEKIPLDQGNVTEKILLCHQQGAFLLEYIKKGKVHRCENNPSEQKVWAMLQEVYKEGVNL